jgi:hypothetical protein
MTKDQENQAQPALPNYKVQRSSTKYDKILEMIAE